jgi:phytoene/squalene synthetase
MNSQSPSKGSTLSQALAASITRAASKQTYYTVRFLVDRDRVPDAYRAYAYFRWVDDRLDRGVTDPSERIAFVDQQRALMDRCYRGEWPLNPSVEERMLVDLIRHDGEKSSGLQSYVRNMMAVMAFDAGRRGRLISQEELAGYTQCLATAVTEALHYFIGNGHSSPRSEARYLAATAAHITHMLRDTLEDTAAGYFNIPREFLESHAIAPQAVASDAYRTWVHSRVRLARDYFKAGRSYLAQVENLRCRIAGYAYIARFEGVLDAIEREDYRLRADYREYKSLGAGLRMAWQALALALSRRRPQTVSRAMVVR